MKNLVLLSLLFLTTSSMAQTTETFDLTTYTIPAGWKKNNDNKDMAIYNITNNVKGTWCQVGIYRSTTSKGNLQADFESEWQSLIVSTYKPTTKPELVPAASENGWEAQGGVAPFTFNNAQSIAMLITMSGFGRCTSIVVLTNTQDYQTQIETFLESVSMKQLEAPASTTITTAPVQAKAVTPITNSGYQFSSTTFDDGWTSTVQEDWVQTVKGNITVFIHYPSQKVDVSSGDFKTISQNAWNAIVAPRYSNLKNYHLFPGSLGYEAAYFISGDVTDAKGHNVHVVLFKKGNSGWLEFITPDKNTFVKAFGIDILQVDYYVSSSVWDVLTKMSGYNKFAVAASDLKGKWSTSFSGMQQYVNVYTGADAGATAYSSSQHFIFGEGNTYSWDINVASGRVGAMKFDGAKSKGIFTMNGNWQIKFPDLEGKPKTYDAFFSCIKGARILSLSDTSYPGYTDYARVE
jgi:hypothetical protein